MTSRRPDWSRWTLAEQYVAAQLRAAGCTDPQPLLGTRAFASGRVAMRCRLCNTVLPTVAAITLDDDFFEDDEPVADVVRAFDEGEPCVTRAPSPRLTQVAELNACPVGTILASVHPRLDVLAYRKPNRWSVTGFGTSWTSEHAINMCDTWDIVRLGLP
jgi:hypothetical protein